MATEFKLSYTGQEIEERLGKAGVSVTYSPQTLTEEQQAQARANMGLTEEELKSLVEVEVFKQTLGLRNMAYYSTMALAVTDANNGTTANADAQGNTAAVGVYTDSNVTNLVLMKDHTEVTKIEPAVDMTIHLNGHTLSFENTYYGIRSAKDKAITVTVDGRVDGSGVVLNGIDGGGTLFATRSSAFVVKGGSYTLNETVKNDTYNAIMLSVQDGGSAVIDRADMTANAVSIVVGIKTVGNLTVTNSNITVRSTERGAYGILSASENANIMCSDSNIKAFANHIYDDNGMLTSTAVGISHNFGVATINNCYVLGVHSAIDNYSHLNVNGGVYESFGHGGIYFEGYNTTSYVRNAELRDARTMPEGWVASGGHNGAGFYIGCSDEAGTGNNTVYMDNCKIYGTSYQIVMKTRGNSLYISNSALYDLDSNDGIMVRIDNNTHKLYLGSGNNFTAENAVNATGGSMASAVIVTNEVYAQEAA